MSLSGTEKRRIARAHPIALPRIHDDGIPRRVGNRTEFHLQRLVDARRRRGGGLAAWPGKRKALRGAGMALQAAGIAYPNAAMSSLNRKVPAHQKQRKLRQPL